MPSSHDTSTIRLPRRKSVEVGGAQERQRGGGVLQDAVDDDVVLGEVAGQRHPTALGDHVAEVRRLGVVVELPDPDGVDRRPDSGDAAVREHRDLVDAVRVQRGHRTSGRGAEPDHHSRESATVVTGGTGQLQGVDHRAVAGQLVVLVEHVQPDRAVDRPVVHRLEGDHRQPAVDGQLGDLGILHAVRPSPEHRAGLHRGHVCVLRLRQEYDVRGRPGSPRGWRTRPPGRRARCRRTGSARRSRARG